jgi:hypothetical protein
MESPLSGGTGMISICTLKSPAPQILAKQPHEIGTRGHREWRKLSY